MTHLLSPVILVLMLLLPVHENGSTHVLPSTRRAPRQLQIYVPSQPELSESMDLRA